MNLQTKPAHKTAAGAEPQRSFKTPLLLSGALLAIAAVAAFIYFTIYDRAGTADGLLVSGNIEAHQSLVSFKDVSSRIVELPFDEGQWVEKGHLLAQVDDSNYRQQVAVDQAALHAREKELASARDNLVAAENTVANDQADFAQKSTDYQRFEELWRQGATSAQSRDQAATAMKQSEAALKRDQALERVAAENIATAEANLKNAEETLRLAKITLGYTTLLAPFSGVILVRQAELGEVVKPGTPIVTLADLGHVWLRAYVSETDLGKIRWGQPATITTDTYPDRKYPGRISFISSSAEFTPKSVETHQERVTLVYRIKIDVENDRHELKPGMPADATIDLAHPLSQQASDGQPIVGH